MRQAELAGQIEADRARLARVEARLRVIEGEGTMSTTDVTITTIDAVRVAALSGQAASPEHEDVGPVVSGLFGQLQALVHAAGASIDGEVFAWYAPLTEGGGLDCHVGYTLADDASAPVGLATVRLPPLGRAATLQHLGRMDTITGSYQHLAVWIEENGYRTDGTAREHYVRSYPEPEDHWVTELQMPLTDH